MTQTPRPALGVAITDANLRKMRGLFASGVTVVTTALDGRLHGVTVSAFTSVSLDPPLVLIALGNETATRDMLIESGIFAVNLLSDDQEFLSERFAARAPLVFLCASALESTRILMASEPPAGPIGARSGARSQ